MEAELTAELERKIIEALPDWIRRHPQLRGRLQLALRETADPRPQLATFEEFIEWVDEDMSAEWINGEVVFMSPASTRHQILVNFLNHILDLFVQKHQLGILLMAPYKMKLEDYGPEPDIIFVAKEHIDRVEETFLDGPADLVVEVVSPESIGRDRGEKFTAYEAAGIPEYWLIDPVREQAEFYRLGENGRYQPHLIPDDGRYRSKIIPRFWLQVDWLWQDPLPSVVDVIRELGIV